MINKVNEKGYRNHQLTEEQKANNREKSKTRARVDLRFGKIQFHAENVFVFVRK
jgi:IS5 family transposase